MNDVGLYYWSWMMTLLIVSFTTNYSSTENRSFYVEIQQSALFWISVHIHLMSYHWCLTFVDCSYCARINFIWNFVWLFGITLDIVSAERMMKKWVKLWCFVYNPCFGSCFWFLHRVEWWMLYCALFSLLLSRTKECICLLNWLDDDAHFSNFDGKTPLIQICYVFGVTGLLVLFLQKSIRHMTNCK